MYDIVADCSDNVPTRYLVNDTCVLSSKPLVSASALRLEGQVMIKICVKCLWGSDITLAYSLCLQLTVYNYQGGPCYRCLYPIPPPPETVTNCSDGGVLGVGESCPLSRSLYLYENVSEHCTSLKVPGIMGCFQALEVLKIASGQGCILSNPPCTYTTFVTVLHLNRIFCLFILIKGERIATLGWRAMLCACVIKI